MKQVSVLDTTLRDGALAEGVSYSVDDKLELLAMLDRLGFGYLELGWPYQAPEDLEAFERALEMPLRGRLTVFGSTRRPETHPERDPNLRAMLRSGAPVTHIYGKAWDLHVHKVLHTTEEENLGMVQASVEYMKQEGKEVIFTAEHFFDGFRRNRAYALKVIETARSAGADIIDLGDSNGYSLPQEIAEGVRVVVERVGETPVGIHAHNDSGLAVAAAIAAIEAGARHVQGSVGGFAARCGMTDLSTLMPLLKLKLGIDVVDDEALRHLTPVTRAVVNKIGVGNMDYHPFVGYKVFAHRTHAHIAAVLSDPESYEPIPPEAVGNERRLLLPGIARASYLEAFSRRLGVDLSSDSAANRRIREELVRLEEAGYTYEDAEAGLELILGKLTGRFRPVFSVERLRLFEAIRGRNQPVVEASLHIKLGQRTEYVASEGEGPIGTLFNVVKSALHRVADELGVLSVYAERIELQGVRLRTFCSRSCPNLNARVTVTLGDGARSWSTIGISGDLIQAIWQALLDGVEYGMYTQAEQMGVELLMS